MAGEGYCKGLAASTGCFQRSSGPRAVPPPRPASHLAGAVPCQRSPCAQQPWRAGTRIKVSCASIKSNDDRSAHAVRAPCIAGAECTWHLDWTSHYCPRAFLQRFLQLLILISVGSIHTCTYIGSGVDAMDPLSSVSRPLSLSLCLTSNLTYLPTPSIQNIDMIDPCSSSKPSPAADVALPPINCRQISRPADDAIESEISAPATCGIGAAFFS